MAPVSMEVESKPAEDESTVVLMSNDGTRFTVPVKHAEASVTITAMLNSGYAEAASKEIKFDEMSTPVLKKVVEYFAYKYEQARNPKSEAEFHIEPELLVALIQASHYLQC
jgi:transcription elongation factor B subunit 1